VKDLNDIIDKKVFNKLKCKITILPLCIKIKILLLFIIIIIYNNYYLLILLFIINLIYYYYYFILIEDEICISSHKFVFVSPLKSLDSNMLVTHIFIPHNSKSVDTNTT